MKRLKTIFIINNVLFAIDENNVFLEVRNKSLILSNISYLPKLSLNDKVIVSDWNLIVVNSKELGIFSIKNNFKKVFQKKYKEGINLYDTSVIDNFICLYLNNDSCLVIDLHTSNSNLFFITGFVFNTNGESIIDSNIKQSNAIIYREQHRHATYTFDDFYIDPATNNRKHITIEKIVKTPSLNCYVIQSKYDYIYRMNFADKNCQIQKTVIEKTFLGDTVYVNNSCYHITNQNIYKIEWDCNEAQLLLNLVNTLHYNDYSGIKILQVYDDIIIFLTTKRGTIVFYSTILNKIIKYEILNRPFYVDCKSIIFNERLYLIDYEGFLQSVSIPTNSLPLKN